MTKVQKVNVDKVISSVVINKNYFSCTINNEVFNGSLKKNNFQTYFVGSYFDDLCFTTEDSHIIDNKTDLFSDDLQSYLDVFDIIRDSFLTEEAHDAAMSEVPSRKFKFSDLKFKEETITVKVARLHNFVVFETTERLGLPKPHLITKRYQVEFENGDGDQFIECYQDKDDVKNLMNN